MTMLSCSSWDDPEKQGDAKRERHRVWGKTLLDMTRRWYQEVAIYKSSHVSNENKCLCGSV